MVFLSILGMSSISDLMTSQIGIRYGKRHISWNKNKTWEGTIAGTVVSFIICSLFMGFYWALIFSFVFLIFDVITNKPLNLADNLLIPIGSSLIYVIIRFIFNFDYYLIILTPI
jgi:dolichol kinase